MVSAGFALFSVTPLVRRRVTATARKEREVLLLSVVFARSFPNRQVVSPQIDGG